MASDGVNKGVSGLGSIIVMLGMIGTIFGIGNHLNQRMNYIAEGSKLNIARVEKVQVAHNVAFEASKARRKLTDEENARHASEDAAKFSQLQAEYEALSKQMASLEECRIWWNRNRLASQERNEALIGELQRRLIRVEDVLLRHDCRSNTAPKGGN
jgi:hypothetical protein